MRQVLTAALLLLAATVAGATEGVITRDSPYPVEDTTQRLLQALEQRGLRVFAQIDHAGSAAKAGEKLPPTRLVLFGDPRMGTELMRCQPTLGLELPQKMLIWEDASGQVHLSYPDPEAVASRYGVGDCGEAVTSLQAALKDVSFAATSEEPSTLSASGPRPPAAPASTGDPAG